MTDTRKTGRQLSLFEGAAGEAGGEVVTVAVSGSAGVPATLAVPDDDADARAFATSPAHNVVLEASAGTGKTSVLVARYVNLLKAGVDPSNILAITFTRKAAAEMRERILRELRLSASRSEFDRARWIALRDRLGDIAISTIDAFCLSLLKEFPLEADLDPGFELADETEVPRLIDETLDQALRMFVGMARTEPDIRLVLAQLGLARTREGLGSLLDRRLVAWDALDRFLARGPADLTAEVVCRRAVTAIEDVLRGAPGGLPAFLADGPSAHPRFRWFLREVGRLRTIAPEDGAGVRSLLERVSLHFLTTEGKPRTGGGIPPYRAEHYPSTQAARRHRAAVFQIAPAVERAIFAFNRDLNVVLARGVRRMFGTALALYRRALEERSLLDFVEVQQRALDLLRQMDEFAQSRFRLEARYHHVLVDEFQDTSRAQWELVSLLVRSWGEGTGLAASPSIFIVGDRKQSIYRFRDADVAVLQEAASFIEALRPGSRPRRAIRRSFRALPALLEFVNDLFTEMGLEATRPDDFSYGATDRFPIVEIPDRLRGPVLGINAGEDLEACARAVTAEIARLLREETVRDRATGVPRRVAPGDIAILFRSRTSHREFQRELEVAGIPAYVYKGLGFFDADETKDIVSLIRYLARPESNLRAAAFLRSRLVRLSDPGLVVLGPELGAALLDPDPPPGATRLGDEDRRVLDSTRAAVRRWLARVDRIPPADLIESILDESVYVRELAGPRQAQAWENLKKMRGLLRRIQNRGYATLARMADHLDALTAGDESNAVLEAVDAVNLMTIHASKGLEFPIVFLVNIARGANAPPRPIRVVTAGVDEPSVSIGPFVSESDEIDRERERHETRRLLYVALTRARDRLYLSSMLKDGELVPGRGSLADVLPKSLRDLFERAATAFPECATVAWTSTSGQVFECRVCREASQVSPQPSRQGGGPRAVLFAPLESRSAGEPVTSWLGRKRPGDGVGQEPGAQEHDDDLIPAAAAGPAVEGALVHRLLQRCGLDAAPGTDPIQLAGRLIRDVERASLARPDESVARAVEMWSVLRSRPDVRAMLESGQPLYEVPFTVAEGGATLRGRIDCVVRGSDGSLTVLEFKTGKPDEVHEQQLELYIQAVRAMYPGVPVRGRLVFL